MLKLPFWPPIHKILVQQQQLIKNLLIFMYVVIFTLIGMGFYFFANNQEIYFLLFSLAGKFGTIALILFCTTLLPGIFQRFKMLPLFSASIILFRRQMGILMFLMALLHSMYISTIPAIMTGQVGLDKLPPNGLYGMISLLILLPVWVTSNDIAQRKLGKFWKTVQRLTYLATFSIFLHVALVEFSAALLIGTILVLEIASWINFWFVKKQKKLIKPEKMTA